MKKKFIIGVLLISLLLITGCAQDCSNLSIDERSVCCTLNYLTCLLGIPITGLEDVQKFLEANPNAQVGLTLISKTTINKEEALLHELKDECGSIEVKDYWKLDLKEDDKQLIAWIDSKTNKVICIKQKSIKEEPQKGKCQPCPELDCNKCPQEGCPECHEKECPKPSSYCNEIDDICPNEINNYCELMKYEFCPICEEEIETETIKIYMSGFEPSELEIKIGTIVRFKSVEGNHRLSISSNMPSIMIKEGESYEKQFNNLGDIRIIDIFTKKSIYINVRE